MAPMRERVAAMDDVEREGFASEEVGENSPHDTASEATFVRAEVVSPSLKRASDVAAERPHDGFAAIAPMPEVEAIRTHHLFAEWYERLEAAEADREFCRHQMTHLLDVARIAYIRVLERGLPFRKEVVYAAALLHDIGKAAQYEDGEPHEVAGARIAQEILLDAEGFDPREKTMIVAAVAQHRRWSDASTPLGKLLYEADKASRPCFACSAREACAWSDERKNMGIGI